MRRAIARWQTWWVRLFVLAVLANVFFPIPGPLDLVLMAAPFLLFLVRPRVSEWAPVELAAPVRRPPSALTKRRGIDQLGATRQQAGVLPVLR